MEESEIRDKIRKLVSVHFNNLDKEFIPGKSPILTGKAVYDDNEINAVIDTLLDGWFGLGKKGVEFESKFSKYVGTKYGTLVNSGSSANLLALNAIKIRRNLSGGEIITPACTFPTTFNPIIQLGFTPTIIDVDKTLNMNPEDIELAITKKTVGIMFAHTLGNPASIKKIREIANKNNLFIVEDCCDALGSKYGEDNCGTFGDVSTFSFYPAHGITLGEGGCVLTNDLKLDRILKSLRDWGRDCYCTTDEKNPLGKCGKRFDFKIGDVTYDHKYIYSNIGYNMKPLELQAAMGLEQLKRIDSFNELRKRNYELYYKLFKKFDKYLEFVEINNDASPVFFGFPMLIKDERIKRSDLLKYLNESKIGTRLLFAGNITKQPAYKDIKYNLVTELKNADNIMKNCFWIGIHPGINEDMIRYVSEKFEEFFNLLN